MSCGIKNLQDLYSKTNVYIHTPWTVWKNSIIRIQVSCFEINTVVLQNSTIIIVGPFMLCLDKGFSEEKWNENEKVRRSNRSRPLDHLPFSFYFLFPHQITDPAFENFNFLRRHVIIAFKFKLKGICFQQCPFIHNIEYSYIHL